jgi:hypothetical protein
VRSRRGIHTLPETALDLAGLANGVPGYVVCVHPVRINLVHDGWSRGLPRWYLRREDLLEPRECGRILSWPEAAEVLWAEGLTVKFTERGRPMLRYRDTEHRELARSARQQILQWANEGGRAP